MTADNPLKTQYAIFEVSLPVSKQKVSCRPWLVKEERILLSAKEAGNIEDISRAIQQTVRNCVLDADFKVEDLSTIDIDYLYIKIRGEAVGNKIKLDYFCNNEVTTGEASMNSSPTTKECGAEFSFNLDTTKVKFTSDISKIKFEELQLTPNYNVKLRFPVFNIIRTIKNDDNEFVQTMKKISAVVDYIVPKTKDADVINFSELSEDHRVEFLESLTTEQFDVLNSFIENIPELTLDAETTCKSCGYVHKNTFRNVASFF
jgi:hypothetical protein